VWKKGDTPELSIVDDLSNPGDSESLSGRFAPPTPAGAITAIPVAVDLTAKKIVEVDIVKVSLAAGLGVLLLSGLLLTYTPLRTSKTGQWCLQRSLQTPRRLAAIGLTYGNLVAFVFLFVILVLPVVLQVLSGGSLVLALGNLSTSTMSLALFPVSKNSVVLYALGIPYERALKFHIFLSRLCFIVIVVHGATVYNFGYEILTMTPTFHGVIPLYGLLASFTLVLVVTMSAPQIRRAQYSLFKKSHYLIYAVITLAILHVPGHSIPLIVCASLLIIDHIVSFIRRESGTPTVEVTGNMTVLTLPRGSLKQSPGDYAWIVVPKISMHMHPFTIASAPHESDLRFVIKDMGSGHFTSQLHKLAASGSVGKMQVMGAYGKLAVRLEEYACLFLAAGGIGITPMASILKHLMDHKTAYPKLQKVILMWSVQDESTLVPFRALLEQAQACPFVILAVSVTKVKAIESTASYAKSMSIGRPDIGELVRTFCETTASESNLMHKTNLTSSAADLDVMVPVRRDSWNAEIIAGGPNDVALLACGPAPLVEGTQHVAMRRGHHFHRETFHF
jgi:NADPH oxidase